MYFFTNTKQTEESNTHSYTNTNTHSLNNKNRNVINKIKYNQLTILQKKKQLNMHTHIFTNNVVNPPI